MQLEMLKSVSSIKPQMEIHVVVTIGISSFSDCSSRFIPEQRIQVSGGLRFAHLARVAHLPGLRLRVLRRVRAQTRRQDSVTEPLRFNQLTSQRHRGVTKNNPRPISWI